MIRDFEPKDLERIKEIHKESCDFPLPLFDSPTNIIKKTIEINGKVAGSAIVHLTCETGLILDKNLPNLTRAKIIKDLFEQLYKEISATDLEDMHVFVVPSSDTHYADFLIKNLGFKKDTELVLFRGKSNEQSPTTTGME